MADDVKIKFRADGQEAIVTSKKVFDTIESGGKKATEAVGTKSGGLGSSLLNMSSTVIPTFFAAWSFGKLLGDIKDATLETISYRDEIAKMATASGASVEFLSAMGFAAEQSGTDFGGLSNGIKRFTKNLKDADDGKKTAADAFDQLGISIRDQGGEMRDVEELFLEVADKLSNLTSETEQAALAQEVFGRSGFEMIPLLKQGSAGIQKLTADAKRLGITFDEATAKQAENAADQINRFETALTALKQNAVEPLIKPLTNIAEKLANLIAQIGKSKLDKLIDTLNTSSIDGLDPDKAKLDNISEVNEAYKEEKNIREEIANLQIRTTAQVEPRTRGTYQALRGDLDEILAKELERAKISGEQLTTQESVQRLHSEYAKNVHEIADLEYQISQAKLKGKDTVATSVGDRTIEQAEKISEQLYNRQIVLTEMDKTIGTFNDKLGELNKNREKQNKLAEEYEEILKGNISGEKKNTEEVQKSGQVFNTIQEDNTEKARISAFKQLEYMQMLANARLTLNAKTEAANLEQFVNERERLKSRAKFVEKLDDAELLILEENLQKKKDAGIKLSRFEEEIGNAIKEKREDDLKEINEKQKESLKESINFYTDYSQQVLGLLGNMFSSILQMNRDALDAKREQMEEEFKLEREKLDEEFNLDDERRAEYDLRREQYQEAEKAKLAALDEEERLARDIRDARQRQEVLDAIAAKKRETRAHFDELQKRLAAEFRYDSASKLTYQRRLKDLEAAEDEKTQKFEAEERKQFENEKKLQIAQALANAAGAIVKTFAQFGWPLGVPMAAAAAAATGVQIAKIRSARYEEGGIFTPAQGPGFFEGNQVEFISPLRTAQPVLDELADKAFNRALLSNQQTTNVNTVDLNQLETVVQNGIQEGMSNVVIILDREGLHVANLEGETLRSEGNFS